MLRIPLAIVSALLISACTAELPEEPRAAMETRTVDYRDGDAVLEGYLVRPARTDRDLPGILVCHAWKGIGDHERDWAEQLAKLGYVVFCPDIYGKGIRPADRAGAGEQAAKYRGDRALMRARVNRGLAELAGMKGVDADRIVAIGFCFGGGTVLELARSGAPVRGVVSLHGNLDTPDPDDAKEIQGEVLVLHGAADPHVPVEQVAAFKAEMEAAGVDYDFVAYEGAVHSFTDPAAGNDPGTGAAYNRSAATQAFAATVKFIEAVTETE
jgi:dienelactone hydrolase